MEVVFSRPMYLWFLLSVAILIVVHFFTLKTVKRKALKFANFDAISRVTGKPLLTSNTILVFLRAIVLIFFSFSLAQTTLYYLGDSNDFSFVVAIDASSSMTADDFTPNRLEASKTEAIDFIDGLTSDTRVGVLSFSGSSFVQLDMTNNLGDVKETIKEIGISDVGGTDLGEAIITAVNMLRSEEKSKVIVLLTDGQSNVGVDVKDAITYAVENEVIVYPIGVASEEGGKILGLEILSKINDPELTTIAENTGGKYYRVEDKEGLAEAYSEISKANRERIGLDLDPILMAIALILLFFEWALMNTKFRTLP
ncbi:MAG: VWA domain-containing protein [Candidatus Nanoarchaeia archaeon]|nr:VWA domain-containing protein [Candidatus Nanoarchaeia archaeon]